MGTRHCLPTTPIQFRVCDVSFGIPNPPFNLTHPPFHKIVAPLLSPHPLFFHIPSHQIYTPHPKYRPASLIIPPYSLLCTAIAISNGDTSRCQSWTTLSSTRGNQVVFLPSSQQKYARKGKGMNSSSELQNLPTSRQDKHSRAGRHKEDLPAL